MSQVKKQLWHQGEIPPGVVLRDICKDAKNNVIVAVADDGIIYRRYGAGIGWKKIEVPGLGDQDHIFGVCVDQMGNFYAGGRGGFMLKGTDTGLEWRIVRKKINDGNVMKLAAGNGMLLAILDRSALKRSNTFLKSTDNGESWFEFNGGIPNACSIEFLANRFYVGTKSKLIYCGNGRDKFLAVRWDSLSLQFQGARCLGYNEVTGTFFGAGHQLATSNDGVEWWSKFDMTKHTELGKRNIQAIVPVNGDTFLIGEDMMMFRYRNAIFEPVGSLGKGSVLAAIFHDDRIILATAAGERYILLEDLDINAGEPPTPPTPPVPPTPPTPPTEPTREQKIEAAIATGKGHLDGLDSILDTLKGLL